MVDPIRSGFAARIGTSDVPSKADYQGANIPEGHFGPQQTGPDEILMAKWIDDSGAFTALRVSVTDFNFIFGTLFAAGKPTTATFTATCNAIPLIKPSWWTGTWPPITFCRGYCRYAAKFQSEGILT